MCRAPWDKKRGRSPPGYKQKEGWRIYARSCLRPSAKPENPFRGEKNFCEKKRDGFFKKTGFPIIRGDRASVLNRDALQKKNPPGGEIRRGDHQIPRERKGFWGPPNNRSRRPRNPFRGHKKGETKSFKRPPKYGGVKK